MIRNNKVNISVIIPCYNCQEFLRRCIDSFITQKKYIIEIILIDDGSTDNTAKICMEYISSDSRFRYFYQKNKGAGYARNKGISVANGEYITFIDADDYVNENYIENLYDTALLNHAEMSICNIIKKQSVNYNKKDLSINKFDILYNVYSSSCSAKLIRRDILVNNKIKFKVDSGYYGFAEDYLFVINLLYNISIISYTEKSYYYYCTDNCKSVCSNPLVQNRNNHDRLIILMEVMHFIRGKNFSEADLMPVFYSIKLHLVWGGISVQNSFMKELKKEKFCINWINNFYFFVITMYNNKNIIDNFYDFSKDLLIRCPKIYCILKYFKEYNIFKNKNVIQQWSHAVTCRINDIYKKIIKYKNILFCNSKRRHLNRNLDFSPILSVVMPVYNSELYVSEAIESILSQTFTDFEFIIALDGCSDRSEEIVNSYHDKRIKVIKNTKNCGISKTLNAAFALAKGKFIARMDADDIARPERLAKQIKFLESNPQVGVVGSWFYIFGDIEPRIETKPAFPRLEDFLKECPLGHPTVMMRKEVWEKRHLAYDPKYKHAEDFELWFRMHSITRLANIQEVLLDYRFHKSGVSFLHEEVQIHNSNIIKQKVKKSLGQMSLAQQIQVDDDNILNILRNIGEFSYMPNSGNMGDAFIASATMQWFDYNAINYHRTTQEEYPTNFVYGGGGAWTIDWFNDLEVVLDKMQKAEQIIILPSSFYRIPKFFNMIDARFIIFCREQQSYNYLKSQKTGARILLDHDMALRMKGSIFFKETIPEERFVVKAMEVSKRIAKLPATVKLFRLDSETKGHYSTDFDLSDALGWFGPFEPRENYDFAAEMMLNAVYNRDAVHTDRLHVGIAAALAGTDVYLYDNSYGKVKGVWQQSLKDSANVKFVK